MIDVVIINKSSNIKDIENIYNTINHKEVYKIYYIADRCSEQFNNELLELSKKDSRIDITILSDYEGRRTSSLRNIGYIKSKNDFNNINGILFLDGDRWFIKGSISDISQNITQILSFLFLQKISIEAFNEMKKSIQNFFYSAGVYMYKEDCIKIENINNIYNGILWNEDIENIWGIEDLFLGNIFNILNLNYTLNKNIILNGSKMTSYKNIEEEIYNQFMLMEQIHKYKQFLNK